MSIIDSISRSTESLTPNEKRLIQAVMDQPTVAALGTASDLAGAVGVHEATASRLARKLGYESYAAFREALRDEFIATRETATRFERTIAESSSGTVFGRLAHQERLALEEAEASISADRINLIARKMIRADRLFFYGYGNSEILALMMAKRFRRFGREVHQLDGDPRKIAEQALGFRDGDLLFTFAFRRPPHGYAPLIETAHEAGVETIVMSGHTGAMLSPQPDHLLRAPRSGDVDGFQTLTVPMTVCNAIVIAAGLSAKKQSLKKLEKLGRLIERFD
ncbi:MurR/RpiR family transcriptional regulator [Litoreibacter roseus]|uniref:RpiR family transcriptional regulator n=1 Tax=Litoreibacter roseus TaxID=2601869 RepID=A0A6N6JGV6_9RHOB|nr:MurR/RpiR family transcriptional regulator [Litoreibacter roseus]GFE65354.1 RpiR family transcriptional regulator [Litoreibacter roseus]